MGEGRGVGSGRCGGHGIGGPEGARWEAALEKVTRSQVGAVPSGEGPPAGTSPDGERSLVVANISRFFCRLPTLVSYVSNLVCHFKRPYSGRGVTRCPESPDVCIFCQ